MAADPHDRDRTELTLSLVRQDPKDRPCLLTGLHKSPGPNIILEFGAIPIPAVLNPYPYSWISKPQGSCRAGKGWSSEFGALAEWGEQEIAGECRARPECLNNVKENRRMLSNNFLMSTSLAALCQLCWTDVSSRRLCPGCHPCAPQGCSAGGCRMLSSSPQRLDYRGFAFFARNHPMSLI